MVSGIIYLISSVLISFDCLTVTSIEIKIETKIGSGEKEIGYDDKKDRDSIFTFEHGFESNTLSTEKQAFSSFCILAPRVQNLEDPLIAQSIFFPFRLTQRPLERGSKHVVQEETEIRILRL